MAAKRKSAKGKTVPRRGKAARASKKSPRKLRSDKNKEDYRAALAETRAELKVAPEPTVYEPVTDEIIDKVLDMIATGPKTNSCLLAVRARDSYKPTLGQTTSSRRQRKRSTTLRTVRTWSSAIASTRPTRRSG
jgi:hypothetical protein